MQFKQEIERVRERKLLKFSRQKTKSLNMQRNESRLFFLFLAQKLLFGRDETMDFFKKIFTTIAMTGRSRHF